MNRAVGLYLEANNGKAPRSWADIEPYHLDPILGFHSVVIVKRYWAVHWDADLMKLYEDAKESEALTGRTRGLAYTRTVYRKRSVKDPGEVTNWCLHGMIVRSIDKLKKEE